MTKYIVNKRTDALKTDINLFFYDNKLSNCALSLADDEFQIHVFVRILAIKISQRARVKFFSAVIVKWVPTNLMLGVTQACDGLASHPWESRNTPSRFITETGI